ncbi:MAG: hypothetical protein MZV64_10815 [Ignavibacteriales bacterium]|nr:hypothetical protein [Ignavibacteriales bacterium]
MRPKRRLPLPVPARRGRGRRRRGHGLAAFRSSASTSPGPGFHVRDDVRASRSRRGPPDVVAAALAAALGRFRCDPGLRGRLGTRRPRSGRLLLRVGPPRREASRASTATPWPGRRRDGRSGA